MTILYDYKNGNYFIKIFSNGTKIRTCSDDVLIPEFPESMDVKITNYCDLNCNFCHEESTVTGKHADLKLLLKTLECLNPGTELAIGGGNPLSHPGLISFLQELRNRNIIPNITVNLNHVKQYHNLLTHLIENKLVFGVGISYKTDSKSKLQNLDSLIKLTNNIVFHTIMGINTLSDIQDLIDFTNSKNKECKILVLGYKSYGKGLMFKSKKVDENIYQWYIRLAMFFKEKNLTLSFDNLAINQMNLKRYFNDDSWNKFYMGDDGKFTMYVDAVNQTFAKSSTSSNRRKFSDISLKDYFSNLSI